MSGADFLSSSAPAPAGSAGCKGRHRGGQNSSMQRTWPTACRAPGTRTDDERRPPQAGLGGDVLPGHRRQKARALLKADPPGGPLLDVRQDVRHAHHREPCSWKGWKKCVPRGERWIWKRPAGIEDVGAGAGKRAAVQLIHNVLNYDDGEYRAGGGIPIMADDIAEAGDIASIAGALVLNIGHAQRPHGGIHGRGGRTRQPGRRACRTGPLLARARPPSGNVTTAQAIKGNKADESFGDFFRCWARTTPGREREQRYRRRQ